MSWLVHLLHCISVIVCVCIKNGGVDAFIVGTSPKLIADGCRQPHDPRQRGALFLATAPVQHNANDPRYEQRSTHQVSIDLPLGIVLEEMDSSDTSFGVAIIGINDGNAAKYNANILSKAKSDASAVNCREDCIVLNWRRIKE